MNTGSWCKHADADCVQSSMRQDLQDIPALAKLPPQALAALEAAQFRADVNNKKVDVRPPALSHSPARCSRHNFLAAAPRLHLKSVQLVLLLSLTCVLSRCHTGLCSTSAWVRFR